VSIATAKSSVLWVHWATVVSISKTPHFFRQSKSAPRGGAQPMWGRNLTFLDETSLLQVTKSSFDTAKTTGFLEKRIVDQTFI
jgi:hypothetical protein